MVVAFHQIIKTNSERCPECGSPKSSWLDGNCPICLMRLGGALAPLGPMGLPASGLLRFPFLGGYELLEEIARGGMGVVYRARQESLNRFVALKVLPGGRFANESFIKRFRREAEALASLNHPNIVAIHEVGEYEGQLYFSMDLIEGSSLAQRIREDPLPIRQAAQLIQRIAEAMAFAHERGLLHRDLKPSNILLDAQGVPHITDFGLAKRWDDDTELTLTGEILGSPNYMAPEQADPNLAATSPASDVYSLGAMLYHLLTGRPPFMAETVAQTLRLVAEGGPVSPRLLRRGVSRDLETICLKCLDTDPGLRYQSAQELADELDRFQRNQPIRARPLSSVAKLARWCRRKPALASAIAGVATLLLVVAIGSPVALLRIQRERESSEMARAEEMASRIRAQKAEREAHRQLYTALVEQAHASVRSGEVGQRLKALDAIRRAAAISNSVDLRREALSALALPDLRFEREWTAGPEFTLRLMDATFERVALCRGTGPVEIRNTSDWRLVANLAASTNLYAYAGWWSPDGRYFAVKRDEYPRGERGVLEIWDVASQRRLLIPREMMEQGVSFHPRLHQLAIGQPGGGVTIWDLEKCLPVGQLQLTSTAVRLQFSPDGKRLAAVEEDNGKNWLLVYDSTTSVVRASHLFGEGILSLDWHPSGRWLAVADQSGTVHLMDSQTGRTRTFGVHKAQAAKVMFSPDGDYLFSGGWERELICWDTRTMQRCLTVGRESWNAQFRSDGIKCVLFTASGIELHDFVRPNHHEFFEDLGPRLRRAVFSADSRWLAAAADQHLGVWDLAGYAPGALNEELECAQPAFINDGKELFALGNDGNCAHWQLVTGTNATTPPLLRSIDMPAPAASRLSFVSNVISFSGSTGGGETIQSRWVGRVQGINGMSPDAKWLGTYQSFSPLLEVYRLPSLEHATTLQCQGNIIDFAFTPAGDQVAIGSRSGVELWSTNTWTRTRVLTNFAEILFSPDRSAWWLITNFRTAGLYDAGSLEPLLPLPIGILPMAISGDGRRLAVSVDLRYLQVWDLENIKKQLSELGLNWGPSLAEAAVP
jgi:serine/threonine protein kinase/WD40 repeat protein